MTNLQELNDKCDIKTTDSSPFCCRMPSPLLLLHQTGSNTIAREGGRSDRVRIASSCCDCDMLLRHAKRCQMTNGINVFSTFVACDRRDNVVVFRMPCIHRKRGNRLILHCATLSLEVLGRLSPFFPHFIFTTRTRSALSPLQFPKPSIHMKDKEKERFSSKQVCWSGRGRISAKTRIGEHIPNPTD